MYLRIIVDKSPKWAAASYILTDIPDLVLHQINRAAATKQPANKSASVKKSKIQFAWRLSEGQKSLQ
jgi:hypothetical protein